MCADHSASVPALRVVADHGIHAYATLNNIAIATIDERDPPVQRGARVRVYESNVHSRAGGLVLYKPQVWQDVVVQRLRAQRLPGWPQLQCGELARRLVVVHWVGGGEHFEPAMEIG